MKRAPKRVALNLESVLHFFGTGDDLHEHCFIVVLCANNDDDARKQADAFVRDIASKRVTLAKGGAR